MNIIVNGKETQISETMTIDRLLHDRGFSFDRVIVEYNGAIVPGDRWPLVTLKKNDRLEVLSFVGGG